MINSGYWVLFSVAEIAALRLPSVDAYCISHGDLLTGVVRGCKQLLLLHSTCNLTVLTFAKKRIITACIPIFLLKKAWQAPGCIWCGKDGGCWSARGEGSR